MAQAQELAQFVSRHFPKDFKGVYVDVGAGFPKELSNSLQFRERGWEVIAVEPQPQMCAQFRELGYPILEFACSATDLGEVDFEICNYAGGMGGSAFKVLDPASRVDYQIMPIKVQAYTLTTLLKKYYPEVPHIDILDIDVEYSEIDVLRGLDFSTYMPTLMCIENLPYDDLYHNPNQEAVRIFCKERGYQCAMVHEYNEYWILEEKTNE